MRRFLSVITLLLAIVSVKAEETKCPIIPLPNKIEMHTGKLTLHKELSVSFSDKNLNSLVDLFGQSVARFSDTPWVIRKNKSNSLIQLFIDPNTNFKSEEYLLEVLPSGIKLSASGQNGLFNGMQSLIQLIIFSEKNKEKVILNCCTIHDQPRYGWRGLMLDESRHFFGKEKVKQLLDYMALHKMNKFHWHLTDQPGWRIEIKKYPKLTTVGGLGNYDDPNAKASYYTQSEIAEIVAHAQQRFIEVIPEIDMPGHASAANRAYPEFSGGGSEAYPEFTFNPGKESTYQYLTDILKEVAVLFPSKYIHIGGDEVHFGNQQWKTDAGVQKLMADNNLKDLVDVEHYFIRRMEDSIQHMGKKLVGWDEISGSGVDKNSSLLMWWRHDKKQLLPEALAKGYEVVMCPRIPLYFDFVQHESHQYGRRWSNDFCPIDLVYKFPGTELDPSNPKIKGIQANVWTERIQNNERLEFMIFPRISALAEAAWTQDKQKDYEDFSNRLTNMLPLFERDKIYYFNPIEPDSKAESKAIK